MSKRLVAYFSASGVTKGVAKKLSEAADADLFEIKPAVPYTNADLDWEDKNSRSTKEMENPTSRPAIAYKVDDMEQYDTVFVGFPIWWYVAPKIIDTFLESYDFSGKNIVVFCTSGSSGLGKTEEVLKKCCASSSHWLKGKRFEARATKETLAGWVSNLAV